MALAEVAVEPALKNKIDRLLQKGDYSNAICELNKGGCTSCIVYPYDKLPKSLREKMSRYNAMGIR